MSQSFNFNQCNLLNEMARRESETLRKNLGIVDAYIIADMQSLATDKVAIEVVCDNKPSKISVWSPSNPVIVKCWDKTSNGNIFILSPLADLRQAVIASNQTRSGGDNNRALLKLLTIQDLKNLGQVIGQQYIK